MNEQKHYCTPCSALSISTQGVLEACYLAIRADQHWGVVSKAT